MNYKLEDCHLDYAVFGKSQIGDKKIYIDWFDKHAKDKFTFETYSIPGNEIGTFNTIDGNTCYQLRCAVLHAGNFDVNTCKYDKIMIHGHDQNSKIFEHEFTETKVIHDNKMKYERIFHLDINKFCNLLCLAAEEYYEFIEDKDRFIVEDVVVLDW